MHINEGEGKLALSITKNNRSLSLLPFLFLLTSIIIIIIIIIIIYWSSFFNAIFAFGLFSFILTADPSDYTLGSIYILSLSPEFYFGKGISRALDLHHWPSLRPADHGLRF